MSRIKKVLEKFVSQKFNDVTIADVVNQYDVDGRYADLAVLKDDGKPILLIETKKVRHDARGFRIERRFIVTSEEVVGQAVAYAAILKRKGIYVPFVMTANDRQLALFAVPENVDELVDWEAIRERRYGKVVKNFYEFRNQNLILHKPHNFSEEFFRELLDIVTGIYKKRFGVEEKRQELHWIVIEDLRGFVDFLAPFIEQAIAPNGVFRADVREKLEDYSSRTGYTPTPNGLAREMAYVLMNKIVFYKVLERFYNIPQLKPLYENGVVSTCSSYIRKLNEYFETAIKVTKDFESIFRTGIYDVTENDVVESEEVLRAFDWLIRFLEQYRIEELGDVIGYVYEELIPAEERHVLGQFYTPKPIAELIVKWCIRSPDDKVLDPGCGSGTFLVEAYKRLAELKLKKPFSEIKHVPEDVHRQILRQLYAIDINEFPAHLTAMNLAMKNVRAPSVEMNIFVRDYFTVRPGFKLLAPYKVRTPEGEKEVEVVFKDFDAVVGNPPYTRWTEIPEATRNQIREVLSTCISKYDLEPQVARGVEPGIYVYWIMHSTNFLKDGGRLGMIISDSWLQTDYGRNFFKFLLDNYKVHAVIDISARVFPVPLIGTCVILLERCSRKEERSSNVAVFSYLDVSRGSIDVDEILKFIESVKNLATVKQPITKDFVSGAKIIARVYVQKELEGYEGKLIDLIFKAEDILGMLTRCSSVNRLSNYFEPSYGNILYLYLTSTGQIRGVRNVGGEEFFYLTETRVKQLGIPQEFLYPLLPSSRYLKFFTFTEDDWQELRKSGSECYLFLCHKPRNDLPESVRRYIQLGEGPNAQIRLRRRPGETQGRPVSESQAAQTRREHRNFFCDWYDLGGVVETPIYVARGARYWMRFVLAKFRCALDDRILALIPRQGVQFDELELKALLAYLNSSFVQLQAEVKGRVAGGVALLELDVKPLSEILILDVKKLPREDVEKLAQLFDKLEAEARRLGGADAAENVFGSELARELTDRSDVRAGVAGLFNTVIKEIDCEVARVLGLEHLVETIRALVLDLVKRRLSRAREAKREAIEGSERLREPQRSRRREGESSRGITRTLDEYFKRS
uniref:Site-specific DNA-methyltransferase (adenine-specific) n=1 Tax=Ignisphaera aggregans TaxID=334771 RepID=A0A7J3Z9D4_9CREN